MGLNNQYHLIHFMKESNAFLKEGGSTQIFNESDAQAIASKMQQNMYNFASKEVAKNLETALNEAITRNRESYDLLAKKVVDGLIQKIPEVVKREAIEFLYNESIMTVDGGKITLSTNQAKKYNDEVMKIGQLFSKGNVYPKDITNACNIINGSLNSFLRGPLFEILLSDVLNLSSKKVGQIVSTEIDNLVGDFEKNINKFSKMGGLQLITSKRRISKVTGSESKENIHITIGEENIEVKSGSQKSDIVLKSLENTIGISAKNYRNTSSQIDLLKQGRVISLINDWPTSNHIMNLAVNGLSAISISESQFNIMKSLFVIQGLAGLQSEDVMSQFLIVNTNRKRKPIIVFSIYDLLFNQSIQGDFENTSIIPIQNLPRTEESFVGFINEATITIKTQLKLSKLQYLTK